MLCHIKRVPCRPALSLIALVLLISTVQATVVASYKYTAAAELMSRGHLLESETYLGAKVEALDWECSRTLSMLCLLLTSALASMTVQANVVAPDKHTAVAELMFRGHLLERDTYRRAKVEALDRECSGTFSITFR